MIGYKKIRKTASFFKTLYKNREGRSICEKLKSLKKGFIQLKYGLPHVIAIEPISHCILNCEFCMLQELKWWKYRRKPRMTFDEFKKIVNDVSWFTTEIQFCGGEPILNQDIFRMFQYCRDKDIYTLLTTNGILLGRRDNIEKIINEPPDKILLAYDSPEKEQYETTRRKISSKRGDLEMLQENIKKLISAKKKSGQYYPIIILQMVLTKKNMDKIDFFWKSVKEFGADYGAIKALGVWPEGSLEYDKKKW